MKLLFYLIWNNNIIKCLGAQPDKYLLPRGCNLIAVRDMITKNEHISFTNSYQAMG
jgi:hypothetical protein